MATLKEFLEGLPEDFRNKFDAYLNAASESAASKIKDGSQAAYKQAEDTLKGQMDGAYDSTVNATVGSAKESAEKIVDAYKGKLDFSGEIEDMKRRLGLATEEAIKNIKVRSPFDTEV